MMQFVRVIIILLTLLGMVGITVAQEESEMALPLFNMDAQALAMYPDVYEAIASANISNRPDGLIGRNAEWGDMYASRFQMGTGYSLRIALANSEQAYILRAFQSMWAGIQPIADDGRVPADVPDAIRPSPDARLSISDVASGASFFLGDACLAMYILNQHEAR
ncbi:MAG: hypothetical protein AAFQ07_12745, partial [Chloroflexota bacterium]